MAFEDLKNVSLTGLNPSGDVSPIPVAGVAAASVELLEANEVWRSGIMSYNGNDAVLFALSADVPGSYQIEYYRNEERVNFMGLTTQYDPAVISAFQGALAGKGDAFQLVYTNGPQAQGAFFIEIRFDNAIQETLRSVGVPISATNLASVTHSVIEGREGASGAYKQTTVSTVGQKTAIDVNVVNRTNETQEVNITNSEPLAVVIANPMGATDVSGLAQEDTLQGLTQAFSAGFQITNQPDISALAKDETVQDVVDTLGGGLVVNNFPADYAKSSDINAVAQAIAEKPDTDVSALAKNVTLTDGSAKVQVTNLPSVQQVSGTVALSGPVEITNDSGNAIPVSGQVSISNLPATQPVSGAVSVSNFPATQAVSGTVNANVTFPATQPVSGSVSVSNLPATQPISATSLPLPTGAATSARQDTGNTSLASLDSKTTVDTDGGIRVHVQNTGNATSALQSDGNASLASIDTKLPTKGQKVSSGSFPVVLASDSTLPLATGAATSALQATGNAGIGSPSDAAVTDATQPGSIIALLKGLVAETLAPATSSSFLAVSLAANVAQTVPAQAGAKGRMIFSTNGTILIGIGFTATATNYSYRIITNSGYEVPPLMAGLSVSLFSTTASTVNVTTTV